MIVSLPKPKSEVNKLLLLFGIVTYWIQESYSMVTLDNQSINQEFNDG